MTEHSYYERHNFQVGDKVLFVSLDDNIPFSSVKIRRICKKTIHLSWEGDGAYFGYINKNNCERGTIVTEVHGNILINAYIKSKNNTKKT